MTQQEWKENFASNLIDILEEKGMTQTQLAIDAGISKSQVSDYINGNTIPSLAVAINMAYALDMDVGDFVDFGDRIE